MFNNMYELFQIFFSLYYFFNKKYILNIFFPRKIACNNLKLSNLIYKVNQEIWKQYKFLKNK